MRDINSISLVTLCRTRYYERCHHLQYIYITL